MIAVAVLATPVIALVVALVVLVLSPLPGALPEAKPTPIIQPAELFAADGTPIGTLRGFDIGLPTEASDINATVVAALVAAEDRNFYAHTGVDPRAIGRAVRENFDSGDIAQGGSTITQQLVKNRYLGGERTFGRKLREAVLAQRLENELNKDEILLAYLADSYFGSGAYGLSAAASVYFNKPASELDASESAMVVGMLPSPSSYSPHVNVTGAEAARMRTLVAMRDNAALSDEEFTQAAARKVTLVASADEAATLDPTDHTVVWPLVGKDLGPYPHFTQFVERYLIDQLGEEVVFSRGLRVETTLELDRQRIATDLVTSLARRSGDPTVGSALAMVEPATGYIQVMASSTSWEDSQVNLVTGGDVGFQAGSSVKPFVLAAALEAGSKPDRTLNSPTVYTTADGSQLRNFGGEAGGVVSIRESIVRSLNTPLLMLAAELDPNAVAATGRRLGVTSWTPDQTYGESVALGAYETSPLDMASAFGSFAARGRFVPPVPVRRVTTVDGQVLIDNSLRPTERVLDEVVADNVNDVLVQVVQRGTGTNAKLSRPVAGKTGTAENFTAAWFVGYTPELSAAVWLGHVDGVRRLPPIDGVGEITGGSLPATLWRQFMEAVYVDAPVTPFAPAQPISGPRPVLVDETGAIIAPEPGPLTVTGATPGRQPVSPVAG
jgi:membrane peptidoglycan carboxypeptidase